MLDDGHARCHECDTTRTAESLAATASGDIGRRTFLAQTGILAAVAALSACGLSGGEPTAPSVPTNSTIDVNSYSTLANIGGVAIVTLGNAPVAVVRTGSTSFLALSRICLHQGGTVQLANNDFVCPVHGATYDLSGKWIGGQRAPSLHQYTTSYDQASGILTIS
jgi:nitrite reductase/ring-hydroxylating ferredoxin subunit